MKIEVLYFEVCCLYGDMSNIRYLKKCIPEAEYIMTQFNDTPVFVSEDVDMIYLGSMPESVMTKVIAKLEPYRDRLIELKDRGTVILFTGNAFTVLGQKIINNSNEAPALGIYDFYTKRDMDNRINSMVYGTYEDIEIVGCKSQFDMYYGVKEEPFIRVGGGLGNNLDDKNDGIHDRNLFATPLLGPLLILNPLFTKRLVKKLGSDCGIAFEKEVTEAYEFRLKELKTDGAKLITLHC